ncbi:MAG: hypothetical protein EZS28_041048 [Streblomastix strix]|uniref:Tyr recombinase domain-containing protein n=1 Tax=Streblomastix strix TaxID=222440 RepID=A0A5J4U152_9EUKA|nr:MAG: hypothetical protein EZS28_041048 [Streblomastix strix]
MGSTSRRASSDFSIRQEQGRRGEELYRQAMKSIGASDIAIDNQIKQMKGSWRRHKTIAWFKTQRLSSSAILNVKTAISTLLISLGHPENKIYNNTTSISTKKERKDTANRIQDRETFNIDDLLRYIRRRVESINEMEQDELNGRIIKIGALSRDPNERVVRSSYRHDKVGGGNVFLTIKRAKDPAICPIHWFSHWWNIQKQRSNNGQILWWDSSRNKPASADKCSQLVKLIIKAAGLPYKQRITELRAAAITKMINLGYPITMINAWSIHSDITKTLQKYYYRANCSEVIDRLLETTLIIELKATTNDSEQQHCQSDDDMSLKATEAKTIKLLSISDAPIDFIAYLYNSSPRLPYAYLILKSLEALLEVEPILFFSQIGKDNTVGL